MKVTKLKRNKKAKSFTSLMCRLHWSSFY